MASLIHDKAGTFRVQFTDAYGKRCTVRIGRRKREEAEAVKVWIETLSHAVNNGQPPGLHAVRWLDGLNDELHGRLSRVGLAEPRQTQTLGEWLTELLEQKRRDGLKTASLKKLGQTRDKLLEVIGGRTRLRQITEADARKWADRLQHDGLSMASQRTHAGNAKSMFAEPVRRGMISANPFESLSSGSTPARDRRYITPDEAAAVVAACPTIEWKLLFGLARFAGLRVPSESHQLTWSDVDWDPEKPRVLVRSPKTERHRGHESRLVPVVPALMQLLHDAYEQAEEGQLLLIPTIAQSNVRKNLMRIVARAGVDPWPRVWQELRASCEQDLAQHFPQHAVSRWLGHSMTVSDKHYLNYVPDELFARAANMEAARNAAHLCTQMRPDTTRGNKKAPSEASGGGFGHGAGGIRTPVP